jgi:ubiquinol-cytochrome c reductase iron-sulfur subunit
LAKRVRHGYQARQAAPAACKRIVPTGGNWRSDAQVFQVYDALKVDMATVEYTEGPPTVPESDGARRRDFIKVAAVSFAAPGAIAALIPLINQMNPSADVLALSSIEVDLSPIQEGQALKTEWRKQPVFIRQLTPAEIQAANAVDVGSLRDPQSLAERTKPEHGQWLITLGVCTHLGCVPLGAAEGENRGEFGGYFCPCHGSHYDTAGRVRKGPAPKNLEVPEYEFTGPNAVRIG